MYSELNTFAKEAATYCKKAFCRLEALTEVTVNFIHSSWPLNPEFFSERFSDRGFTFSVHRAVIRKCIAG
jgi:hypothetical protein